MVQESSCERCLRFLKSLNFVSSNILFFGSIKMSTPGGSGGGSNDGSDKNSSATPSETPIRRAESSSSSSAAAGGLESKEIWGSEETFEASLEGLTTEQLRNRISILVSNTRILKSEESSTTQMMKTQEKHIRENEEKIKLYKVLPYLIGNVVEVSFFVYMCI